ncbi:MAG: zinc-dependent peptidase [Zoogloeaceae bacterium]|nr:zinc-dependent peptidase [Zoogloeaceae bacterium]
MIANFLRRFLGKREPPAIPEALWLAALARQPYLARLDAVELDQLRSLTKDFLAEKEFTTTGGLKLDNEMCLSIALQACLPILHLGLTWYRGWVGIVVHLDEFIVQRNFEDEDGVVHEYQEIASGEAWNGGPVLISWKDAQMTEDSYNVVIHEFVHKIDMLNGDADGIPPLHADMSRETWETCLLAAYDDFCQRLSISEVQGTDTMIDPYAADHPGEFFAVISEMFFTAPEAIYSEYPDLFHQLSLFYRTNPLGNISSRSTNAGFNA